MTKRELLGPDWLEEEEFAKARGAAVSTLQKERSKDPYTGPPFMKDGQDIYYSVIGFRQWLADNIQQQMPTRSLRRR